jgi:hypothetical protein
MKQIKQTNGSQRFLRAVASAFIAAGAMRAGMPPRASDLNALGIDAESFRAIRLG